MAVVDMEALKDADGAWKPGNTNKVSQQLAQLFEDQATDMTLDYLRTLGLGNKRNVRHPLMINMMRRAMESQSVVYAAPALRQLMKPDGTAYGDEAPETLAMTEAFDRSVYDLLWRAIDVRRNTYRTIVVEWIEDNETGAVSCYVFPPHLVMRMPDASAPSSIMKDKYVALQIRAGGDPKDALYRVWVNNGDGSRRVYIVDYRGELAGQQPYDAGVSPYGDTLPVQLIYDEHPLGDAWLAVPESRVSWALGLNGAINDLAYLIQMEAHSIKFFKSEQAGSAPTETGPDAVVEAIGEQADLRVLRNHPHIQESALVIDQYLRLWMTGEYLPADTFLTGTIPQTGQALKVKERDLSARRARQAALMPWFESKAFERYLTIHNRNAYDWSAKILPTGARMNASPGRNWQPVDTLELQNVLFRDLALGFISRIDYRMERFGETRAQAIAALQRIAQDNQRFPLTQYQNPMAMVDQKGAGPLPNSATPSSDPSTLNPGTLNPSLTTSTKGASVTRAAIQNMGGDQERDSGRDVDRN